MKYLCLIYQEENVVNRLPDSDWQLMIKDCQQCTLELQEAGHFLAGNALAPTLAATSLRVRNGKVLITDGPFAETKEQLAGFCLVEARDLNQAIQLASNMPPLRLGSIEVRPVRELQANSLTEKSKFSVEYDLRRTTSQ